MKRWSLARCFGFGVIMGGAGFLANPQATLGADLEGSISLTTSKSVVSYGETMDVTAWGHFPEDGYALANAAFDIHATALGWSNVSSGLAVGGNVKGIDFSQDHAPALGVIADPSNPLKIWSGTFKPESDAPQLLHMGAVPTSMAYYPSDLTGSSVELDGRSGRRTVLVNPLELGNILVAPGNSTTLSGAGDDLLIGGTTTYDQRILIGMLLPAIQKVRIVPGTPPDDLTFTTEVEEDGSISAARVNFALTDAPSTYQLHLNWTKVQYYEIHCKPRDAGEGDVHILILDGNANVLPTFSGTPTTFASWIETDSDENETRLVTELGFDQPVQVKGSHGFVMEVESVEIHACQNNLKQIGLASHNYESVGTGGIIVSMGDGSVRSIRPTVQLQ